MTFYHSTTSSNAACILREGFEDCTDTYLMGIEITGVWLSDFPLDENEGCKGNCLLPVDLAIQEAEIADYEIVQEDWPYREWCLPAALVNAHSVIKMVNRDDAADRRFE